MNKTKSMELDFNGVNIQVCFAHTERDWKGKINVYDVEIGKQVRVRFLDNYNREVYRDDLITRGVLTYIVDSYERKNIVNTTYWKWDMLDRNLDEGWIDSVKVFLKMAN